MDVKQEVLDLKQEELIIKDEYICDLDPGSTSALALFATKTECLQLDSEDCSYQSETTSTTSNNSSYRSNLKCRINCQHEYFCVHCDFKTTQEDHLKQHLLTHSGENPYHCKQCDFKTSYKGTLNRHILSHSNLKPHHCKQCDYKTSHKSCLKVHMLNRAEVTLGLGSTLRDKSR